MSGTTPSPAPAAPTPPPTVAKPAKNVWQELDTWGAGLPRWQRYALARAVASLRLTPGELDITYQLLLADGGLGAEPVPVPVIPTTITGRPPDATVHLELSGLANTVNINALPNGSKLTFGPNLTVIFGSNSAGKSGFFRVLAWACFSRSRRPLLPNVYASGGASTSFSADIHIKDTPPKPDRSIPVTATMGDTELRRISVFDSKVADAHVQGENAFSFRPTGFDVFSELVRVVGELSRRLDDDVGRRTSENTFPNLLAGAGETAVTTTLQSLSSTTKDDALRALGTFGPTERARFAEIAKQLNELKATSVEHLRTQAQQDRADVAALTASLRAAYDLLGKARLDSHASGLADYQAQEKLAASESLNALTPGILKSLGTPAWQRFVLAAQEVASTEGEGYPNIGQPCLLCHRPIDSGAHVVLHATWKFLQGEARRRAAASKKTLDGSAAELRRLPLDIFNPSSRVRPYLDRTAPDLSRLVVDALAALTVARESIASTLSSGTGVLPAPIADSVTAQLDKVTSALDAEVTRLASQTKEDVVKALTQEYTLLRHREILAKNLPAVLKWLEDRRWTEKATAYKRKALNTKPITDKETSLSRNLLGAEYERILSEELVGFDCDAPLTPRMKGQSGQTVRSLALSVKHEPKEVLSEGEQRAVALADFFTEVSLNPASAGIVLDDPVSSMDNDRKERIALRLVAEAAKRQVIVFTHDMEFLALLCDNGKKQKLPVVTHWVQRDRAGVPGAVSFDDRPESSALYRDAEYARKKLAEAKAALGTPRVDALRHGFGVIRTCVEHLVLFRLFQDVVSPYRRHVKMATLEKFTWSDAAAKGSSLLHGDVSTYIDAHFRPDGTVGSDPKPDDLQKFIDRYEALRAQMPKPS